MRCLPKRLIKPLSQSSKKSKVTGNPRATLRIGVWVYVDRAGLSFLTCIAWFFTVDSDTVVSPEWSAGRHKTSKFRTFSWNTELMDHMRNASGKNNKLSLYLGATFLLVWEQDHTLFEILLLRTIFSTELMAFR